MQLPNQSSKGFFVSPISPSNPLSRSICSQLIRTSNQNGAHILVSLFSIFLYWVQSVPRLAIFGQWIVRPTNSINPSSQEMLVLGSLVRRFDSFGPRWPWSSFIFITFVAFHFRLQSSKIVCNFLLVVRLLFSRTHMSNSLGQ